MLNLLRSAGRGDSEDEARRRPVDGVWVRRRSDFLGFLRVKCKAVSEVSWTIPLRKTKYIQRMSKLPLFVWVEKCETVPGRAVGDIHQVIYPSVFLQ